MKHAFRIGELANLYGIGTDTIRYYEEQGLIVPKRAPNGYRMYSIRDIWRMNVIRDLRGLGFSLERIRDYMDDRSVDSTLRLLEQEQAAVDKKIADLQVLRGNVTDRIDTILEAQRLPFGTVEEIDTPQRYCHQIEEHFSTDEEVDVLMKQLVNRNPDRLYLIGSSRIGCRVPLDAVRQGNYRGYNAVFLIDSEGTTPIAGGRYLRLRYQGNSAQTTHFVPVMLDYAQKEGLQFADDILELIWVDIHEAADIREHITELQVRVE